MMRYHSRRPEYSVRPGAPAVWIVLFICDVLALAALVGVFVAVLMKG